MESIGEYSKAYVEVLEFIKLLDKDKYNKIPKERIEIYEEYKDRNYNFMIDRTKTLESQLSPKARAVIANLFVRYIATNEDKEEIFVKERKEYWEEEVKKSASIQLNPLFKNRAEENDTTINKTISEKTEMVQYSKKNSILRKLYDKIKSFFINRRR